MRSVIALEGIPGTGKTSCFSILLQQHFSNRVFLSEINPEPGVPWAFADPVVKGDYFDELWRERTMLIKESSLSFVLDRSYLSNLAYWYATDGLLGTSYYPKRKEFAFKYFEKTLMNAVVVLHCSVNVSIQRRKNANIPADGLWNEPIFLKHFSEFYEKEIHQLATAKAYFIDTSQLITSLVVKEIQKRFGWFSNSSSPNDISKEAQLSLESFADKNRLGSPLANACYVLGLPTMYYRQHSVQYDNGLTVFFNNQQFKKGLHATR